MLRSTGAWSGAQVHGQELRCMGQEEHRCMAVSTGVWNMNIVHARTQLHAGAQACIWSSAVNDQGQRIDVEVWSPDLGMLIKMGHSHEKVASVSVVL